MYLNSYGKRVGVNACMFEATDKSNHEHCSTQIKQKLAQNKPHYIFEGIAFKAKTKVPIIEESQKLKVAEGLRACRLFSPTY